MDESDRVIHVDHAALRTNQAFIIGLLVLSFIFDADYLVVFVCLVMMLGTVVPALSLFKLFYKRVLLPAGFVKSDVVIDNAEPHRFAQGFGAVVLAGALFLLFTGSYLGWILVWLVIMLAGLNLFIGFCAGCFMYYQFNRLNVPGFSRNSIKRGG